MEQVLMQRQCKYKNHQNSAGAEKCTSINNETLVCRVVCILLFAVL